MLSDQEIRDREVAEKIREGLYQLGHGLAWAGFWIGFGLVFVAYAIVGEL